MKARVLGALLILTLIGAFPTGAEGFDINGLWRCTSLSRDCWAIFSQEGERVHMMLSGYYRDALVVYYGSGVIQGDRVIFWTHLTRKPPSWTDGHNELTISPDEGSMKGSWFADGLSGNLEFLRYSREGE